jgi:subtilase family serine protease
MIKARSLSTSCRTKPAADNARQLQPRGKNPTRNRGRKARIVALAAGAGALAAAALTAEPVLVGASAASGPPASARPRVDVKPGIAQLGGTLSAAPTTAQCEELYGIACYQPGQIRTAYNLPALYKKKITGKGATIVIVDPFGSPTIRNDLTTFDKQFGYPAPPSLKTIAPAGKIPAYDANDPVMVDAAGETTLDVEYAHALAPGASILLVETPDDESEGTAGFPQIVAAEKYVIDHGLGDVISQSFSATEETFTSYRQLEPLRAAYLDADAHHVTVLDGSGDSGATGPARNGTYSTSPVTQWPASDPLVAAVGGTQLTLSGGKYTSVAWNDTDDTAVSQYVAGDAGPNPAASGGGKSEFFGRPQYQDGVRSVAGTQRAVPDIAMSAAVNGAVVAYGTFGGRPPGWSLAGGTSEATPEFAAIVAMADQVAGRRLGLLNPRLYALSASHAPGIVDVTSGNNTVSFRQGTAGKLCTVQGYPARKGYDLVTGVGTVNALYLVYELASRSPRPSSY